MEKIVEKIVIQEKEPGEPTLQDLRRMHDHFGTNFCLEKILLWDEDGVNAWIDKKSAEKIRRLEKEIEDLKQATHFGTCLQTSSPLTTLAEKSFPGVSTAFATPILAVNVFRFTCNYS